MKLFSRIMAIILPLIYAGAMAVAAFTRDFYAIVGWGTALVYVGLWIVTDRDLDSANAQLERVVVILEKHLFTLREGIIVSDRSSDKTRIGMEE